MHCHQWLEASSWQQSVKRWRKEFYSQFTCCLFPGVIFVLSGVIFVVSFLVSFLYLSWSCFIQSNMHVVSIRIYKSVIKVLLWKCNKCVFSSLELSCLFGVSVPNLCLLIHLLDIKFVTYFYIFFLPRCVALTCILQSFKGHWPGLPRQMTRPSDNKFWPQINQNLPDRTVWY